MNYAGLQKRSLEKLPPHDLDAEQALLGAILIHPPAIKDVLTLIDPEDFYRPGHAKILQACAALTLHAPDREELDLISLRDLLEQQHALDDIGGLSYLAALVDQTPTAANFRYHAQIIREKAILRRLLNAGIDFATDVYQSHDTARNLIESAKERIDGLFRQTFQGKDMFWVQDKAGIAVDIQRDKYLEFLFQQFGFAMLDLYESTAFVRQQQNIISLNKWVKSTNKTIKQTLRAYCRDMRRPDVWQRLIAQNALFSYASLTGLECIEDHFARDTADMCQLYFQNGIIRITATQVAFLPYERIDGYIWEESIVAHEYVGAYHQDWLPVLRRALHAAMKAQPRDALRIGVLRRIITNCQYWQVDRGHVDRDVLDRILRGMLEKACERGEIFQHAKQQAFVEDERREMDLLEEFQQQYCQTPISEYQQFLEYVSKERIDEQDIFVDNLHAFEFALAYLVHQHNNPANMRAVILADSNPSFVSNGRRGKKIILDALKHLRGKRGVVKEDGKAFEGGRFKFQRVQQNTRIIILDDVAEDFDFKLLYSAITDQLVVEAKTIKSMAFSFEDNPKFAITTNHPAIGEDVSSSERAIMLPVSDYFTRQERTPYQVFGHLLYDDWDAAEWDRFFDYMIGIIQRYLQRPDPSVVPVVDLSVFNANKLLLKVAEPLINYLDSLTKDIDHEFENVRSEMDAQGVKFRTTNELTKALHTYCRLRGYRMRSNMKDGRLMYNGKRYLNLQPTTPELYESAYKKPK